LARGVIPIAPDQYLRGLRYFLALLFLRVIKFLSGPTNQGKMHSRHAQDEMRQGANHIASTPTYANHQLMGVSSSFEGQSGVQVVHAPQLQKPSHRQDCLVVALLRPIAICG
jgi:hypothetical protein